MKKITIQMFMAVLALLPLSAGAVYLESSTSVNTTKVISTTSTEVKVTGNVESKGNVEMRGDNGETIELKVESQNEVSSGTDITGDPDFDLFANSVKAKNANVSKVDVDAEGEVSVLYKHKGRLLGFIPVTVTSRTTVKTEDDGSATVEVRLPWWSFLVGGASDLRSDVEAGLNSNAAIKANAQAKANASTQSRVKLVEAIISSLDATADVSATVDTNTEVSY